MKKLLLLVTLMSYVLSMYAQVTKTVNIAVAGTLSTALTPKELTTVTTLTLTGTIDARDFKTMRDEMPVLAVLDLSGVNIAEYHGNEVANVWRSVDFPANTIPEAAFYDGISQGKTSLTSVVFPTTMTSFGQFAFGSCTGLTAINIPPSVISIGTNAFSVCNGTTTISIPSSVTSIGDNAFNVCSGFISVDVNNLNYSSIDGVLFNKTRTTLIQCPTSKEGSYTIPSTVNSIGHESFNWCTKLKSVIISSSVLNIEQAAFAGCSGMNSIFIASSVTSIGQSAFLFCSGLINVDTNNQNYSSIDGILFNKSKTSLIQCPVSKAGAYTIPSSVVAIEINAFANCTQLISVEIPFSVQKINDSAFYGCSGLTSLSLPSSVTSLGNSAFASCNGLNSLTVARLVPMDLSKSVDVFSGLPKTTCKLYVPYGSSSLYSNANQWKDFTNIVEMPGFHLSATTANIKSVQGSTASIDITANVTWTASSDQTWLTVSPTSGLGIGQNIVTFTAEANPLKLTRTAKVTISASGIEPQTISITQNGGGIEVTAGNLKTLLADQLSTITNLTLTGTIDARDFKTMRDEMPVLAVLDLSGVAIAAYNGEEGPSIFSTKNYPVNTIPDCAFNNGNVGKTSLTSISLPLSITSIGNSSFESCYKLTTLSIPPLVTSIQQNAFSGCSGLSSVSIPASVSFINEYAFYKCIRLTSLFMEGAIPPDEYYYSFIFYGIDLNLCTLYVPYGTTSRYATAHLWLDFKNIVEPPNGFLLSSTAEKVASASGSTTKINITANVGWKASSDQTWLSVSSTQGTGNQTLAFTAQANETFVIRRANVTISSANLKPQTIVITQDGANYTLNLSPGSLSSALTSEELKTVTNLTLTGTIDARDFITLRDHMPLLSKLDLGNVTIAEFTGIAEAYTQYTYPANIVPDRAFYENIYYKSCISSIVLPKSLASINGYAFGYKLTSLTVNYPVPPIIDNPNLWTIDSNCTLYVPYGAANLYKTTAKWKDFSQIVEASNGFHMSNYHPFLAGEEGSKADVNLITNVGWTISSDQDWLVVSPLSGNANQTITFKANANPLFSTRTAIITVSGTGVSSQTVTLTQNFKIQPLKTLEVKAGGLSTALSTDELNTISKLTLTGTIDARDFKTMRDKMPVLAELDISGVNIVSYNGSEGTNLWGGNMNFPDNTIPETAFSSYNHSNGKYYGKLSLNSVIIPSTTRSIGHSAFYGCQGLTSFSIPTSVTSILSEAFRDCKNLTSITIPSTVKSIEANAYLDCVKLNSIAVKWLIPLDKKTNDYNIFDGFDKTACTLYVPYGTTNRYAVANQWKEFTHIVEMPGFFLPETTAKIESTEGSKSSVEINSDIPWTANSDQTWLSVSPSSGKGIGQKLTFTANGNSLFTTRTAKITVSATGVESQTITVTQDGSPINLTPGGLTTVLSVSELSSITKLTLTGNIDARDFKTMRDKMPLLAELNLSGVTIVAYKGYEGTSQVGGNIDYPANAIPESAFYNGSIGKPTLTSVVLPSSLTSIGQTAFAYCNGIRTIIIPPLVTSIGNGAFHDSQNLTSLTIPSSVNTIVSGAFLSCKGLTSIIVGCSFPPDLKNSNMVFYNVNKSTCILHVPYGTTSRYATAYQWKDFLNIVEASEGFNLSSNIVPLFAAEGGAANIDITSNINWTVSSDQTWLAVSPSNGTGIGQKLTFTAEANPLFTTRTATVTVSAIGSESQKVVVTQERKLQPPKTLDVTAGSLSSVLTAIELNTITDLTLKGTIDARDFKTMRDKMPLLSKLNLNEATIVAYNGSEGTSNWQNNDYPANTIPEFAFLNSSFIGKTSLTSVVLPSSMTSFGQYSFMNCNAIKDIIIPSTVTTIGDYVFYNCAALIKVNIPAAIKNIGIQSFGYLSGPLTVDPLNLNYSSSDGVLFNKAQTELIQCPVSKTGNYMIPLSVTSIGNNAFRGCYGLTGAFVIPSSVTSIGTNSFYGCRGLTSITIPLSVTSIGGAAFNGCSGLGSINAYPVSPINLETSKDVFYNVYKSICTLYIPSGSKSVYQAANQWKDFTKIVEFNPVTVANAGPDQIIYEGTQVTLDGTGSTNSNFSILTYQWTAPLGITLSSETSSKPTFTAPKVTTDTNFTFSLVVKDGSVNSLADQVVITVKQVNKSPMANAGPDQAINEGSVVTLDGSGSTSASNNVLTYKWTAPVGITLSSETVAKPTFTAPEVNQDTPFTFSLVVIDGTQSSTAEQVVVTVKQILPILKLTSKTNNLLIPTKEVIYHLFLKKNNSFSEENLSPIINGDATQFSIEPGEWIVLASPVQNSALFVPTYMGNVLNWNDAEHIIIPDKGNVIKEITCFVPELTNIGLGQISGYVYEDPNSGTKSISITKSLQGSGSPIQGALIRLLKKDGTVPISSVFTDYQGYYKFDRLEIKDYNLIVELPGFVQPEKFDLILSNEVPTTTAYFRVNMTSQVITNNSPLLSTIITLYPNPTKGIINIIGLPSNRNNTIAIYTIEGKRIKEKTTSSATEVIDISDQISAIYILVVNNQAFKIWKK